MNAIWVYVLMCLAPGTCDADKIVESGQGQFGHKTKQECEGYAHDIAQRMYVVEGHKYGYYCQRVDYDPPKLWNEPEVHVDCPMIEITTNPPTYEYDCRGKK